MKDSIGGLGCDCRLDSGSVECGYCGLVIGGKEYPVGEVGSDGSEGVGLEGMPNVAGA